MQRRGPALYDSTVTQSRNIKTSVVPTNFDNFVLKQWLYSVGPIHRYEALRKLKRDLQNLGYTRKQVYHGLVQLATKPQVILTRVSPHKRLRRSLDKNGSSSDDNYEGNAALAEHSKHGHEKVPRPKTPEVVGEEEDKPCENSNTSVGSSIERIHGSLASRGVSTFKDYNSGMFHSVEKVLDQFDKCVIPKMNFCKKSSTSQAPISPVRNSSISHNKIWTNNENTGLGKHFPKDTNRLNNAEKKNPHELQKEGTSKDSILNRGKKRCIRPNLNLSNTRTEGKCTYSASSNVEMNYTDVGIKVHSETEFIDSEINITIGRDTNSKCQDENNVLITKIINTDENPSKKEVHSVINPISPQRKTIFALVNENNELDIRRRKQLRNKFRIYFGNYITGSEGEEEEEILNARFKRRRKKDSVDSCDSGVSVGITCRSVSAIGAVEAIQRCTSDCTIYEDRCGQSVVYNVTIHEPEKVTREITTSEQTKDTISGTNIFNKINGSDLQLRNSGETENEEIFLKTLTNVCDTNNRVLENTIVSTVENSQVSGQLGIDISVFDAENKVEEVLTLDTEDKEVQLRSKVEQGPQIELGVETQLEVEALQGPLNVKESQAQPHVVAAQVQPQVVAAQIQSQVVTAQVQQQVVAAQVQPQVVAAQVEPQIEETQVQPQVEGAQVQPQVERAQVQPQVEGAQVQPQLEELQVQSQIAAVKVQLQVGMQTQLDIKEALAEQQQERVKTQSKAEANSESKTEEVKTQSAEVGRVEAQIRASTEVQETDVDTSCETLRICTSDSDMDDEPCQIEESNKESKIFDELLKMSFTNTCRITSNGNVLSIQETIKEKNGEKAINKGVDENGNLKILPSMPHYDHTIGEDMPSSTQDTTNVTTKDIQLTIGKKQNIKDICTNNDIFNVSSSKNEQIVQNSEVVSETQHKNVEQYSSTVSHCRLRVLSSAELGARWCPTPTNNLTSTVNPTDIVTTLDVPSENTTTTIVSSVQLETQAVPLTVTAPITTSVSTNDVNLQVAESVYVIFVKISNLIQSVRISSPITKLDYNKLLHIEFEKLKKMLNTENYVALIEGVLCTLNKELVLSPQLSLLELFRYTPLVKSLYFRCLHSFKISATDLHGQKKMANRITSRQNRYCNQKSLQSVTSVSVQSRLRDMLTVPNVKDQATNISSKQVQQNSQENTVAQPQNSTLQCNMGMSSTNNNYSTQQTNCKTSVQRACTQQKLTYGYFIKHKPMTNMYGTQGFASQYSSYSSTGNNQLDRRYISAPVTDTSCINQNYSARCVAVPQVNTLYNVNPPSYLLQQNMNSTYINTPNISLPLLNQQYQCLVPRQGVFNMPQGLTVQSVPHVALNCITQPAQAIFTTNIPHSISKTAQQNEKIDQNVLPQVQSSKVLQNHVLKQIPVPQHVQNACTAKIKEPVCSAKKLSNTPVSLESTTKLFDVLKYITHVQKIILLKQMDFYFGCTIWLEQQFTSDQWEKIHSQRSLLLQFQTLLKHLVEKTIKDMQNHSQVNMAAINVPLNTTIDIPKTVEMIQQKDNEIYYQISIPIPESNSQNQIQNTCQNSITGEENTSITVERQSVRHKEIDTLQNKEESSQTQELAVSNEQNLAQDKLTNDTTLFQNKLIVVPEIKTIPNITEQTLDTGEETTINDPEIVNDNLSEVSDLKSSNEVLQQSNLHLVTVEISSNRDQVTVVDTNSAGENESTDQNVKEFDDIQEQKLKISNHLSCLDNTVCEESLVTLLETCNDTTYLSNADANDCSPGELISQIADVRSISLEAFEQMGHNEKVFFNTSGTNIEEEEMKVCLLCGKSSTVACSVCLEAKYCSKTCFLLHWEKHYTDCTPVKSIYS